MVDYHKPVLLKEVVQALDIKPGRWYLDATLGDGGHSLEILKSKGNVIGLDIDLEAVARTSTRFRKLRLGGQRFKQVAGNFRNLKKLVNKKFAGILFDLGVSTWQLDSSKRGFSFSKNGPLDMRMDLKLPVKAMDLVNGLNKGELYELFTKLGEEGFAKAISAAVVLARSVKPIHKTTELASIVERIKGRHGKIHPATKVFQALRIAVNDELNALEEALPQALDLLKTSGKLVVISFHSLEDRIVKKQFKSWQDLKLGEILTKKPITPSTKEMVANQGSRSAKLRIFAKI